MLEIKRAVVPAPEPADKQGQPGAAPVAQVLAAGFLEGEA
jgi:hypothetical protein